MNEYFPELKSFGRGKKVELDFSNYATKTNSKYAAGVDTSKFAEKIDLVSLKSNVDKLLSKLSYVLKNAVVKKDVYNAKIKNIEDKTPDVANLATKILLMLK